jgi:hypothetical protein
MAEGERAQVIHAKHVVGVAVRVEHGVEVLDTLANSLRMKVLTGVDQDVPVVIRKENGWPRTPVR